MTERPADKSPESGDFSFLNDAGEPRTTSTPSDETCFPEIQSVTSASLPTVASKNPSLGPRPRPMPENVASDPEAYAQPRLHSAANPQTMPRMTRPWLAGYATALTLLLLFLLLTQRIHIRGNHPLESLPDLRPLAPNEFKVVPQDLPLPEGHVLKPAESRRFGDVVVTPLRVTVESLGFEHFDSRQPVPALKTEPVFKLWLHLKNMSSDYAFPPLDAALLAHRSPEYGTDDSTRSNTFLLAFPDPESPPQRILNFLQHPDSNFLLTGQNAGKVLGPGEELITWVASAARPAETMAVKAYRWRIQIRKGVHVDSGRGVTTLVDCEFLPGDIETPTAEQAVPQVRWQTSIQALADHRRR